MAANQFERHGKARAKLKQLFANPERVSVIHYSCESFYNLPDGRSLRITSIAVRKLDNAQTESFSIDQVAEIRGASLRSADIEPSYNEYEKVMLDEFFEGPVATARRLPGVDHRARMAAPFSEAAP